MSSEVTRGLSSPLCRTQKAFAEMNISCLERGSTVCSVREGEDVTEAMRKYTLSVWWLPQLSTDLLRGGSGGKALKYFSFYTISERAEFETNF